MIDLVIAEDHVLVRSGLCALLNAEPDLHVVGEATTGHEALDLVDRLRPHVLLLDVMLPGLSGLAVLTDLARLDVPTRTVVTSMHANDAYVVEVLRRGALGFVPKDADAAVLLTAIREAAAGRRYLGVEVDRRIAEAAAQGLTPDDPLAALTDRERQTFYLAVQGLSNGEVAARLYISPRTSEKHRANLLKKLGLRTQADLLRFAALHGLVPGLGD